MAVFFGILPEVAVCLTVAKKFPRRAVRAPVEGGDHDDQEKRKEKVLHGWSLRAKSL